VVPCGDHGGNRAAFALADESDAVRIDFRPRSHVRHGSFDVSGEIGGGGLREIASG